MSQHAKLMETTRIALAAYLHDIGKLAERAGAFDKDPRLAANLTLYSPFHEDGRWFSHRHAANTALAIDHLEPHMPALLSDDPLPFAGRRHAGVAEQATDATDSLINAAAAHHKPATFLQWIVATADRVASGFEREEFERYNDAREQTAAGRNHYQARLLTLFEQLRISGNESADRELEWRYPLRTLSPASIIPATAADCEPRNNDAAKAEYAALWSFLCEQIRRIPASHRASLPLWLDHFDSLWLTTVHAVPAATAFGVRPEVSLYDHSRTTAALAAALWRWHEENSVVGADAVAGLRTRDDWSTEKFLLVQGDFFGIQDFIFSAGGQTRKRAARLLRGRSLQVSMFTEVAALRILDGLGLPPTSQVINAAGKFLIVAQNTPEAIGTLERVRNALDTWFEQHAFGQAGIGLAWEAASCNDFLRLAGERNEQTPFSRLLGRLHDGLERAKYRRFTLATRGARVFTDAAFPFGPCAFNGRLPADRPGSGSEPPSCALSRDQIRMGEAVVRGLDRLLVVEGAGRTMLGDGASTTVLGAELFGYVLAFTRSEEATGRFGDLAASGALRRCWDFSAPCGDDDTGMQPLFAGYARRFVSGYVPRVAKAEEALSARYERLADEDIVREPGEFKTLDMLACEDRQPDADGRWLGVAALGVLKGDVDDLGEVFRLGLRQPSFAKWASLSRQVNAFFTIRLPWLLAREFPSVYTVFAGGDDFLLIGPWRTSQRLAARMRAEFDRYVAGNPALHFSAGIATAAPGAPVPSLADTAEEALRAAKRRPGKDAVTCFGETVPWDDWLSLEQAAQELDRLRDEIGLSTGYVYGLLQFIEMQRNAVDKGDVASTIWRARLAYRTRRMLLRKKELDEAARQRRQAELVTAFGSRGVERHLGAFRIPVFNHLYSRRDR